ncbi:MAG: hypothetical protein K1X89_28935 [Myxococcaceae bacterium]|nr:hypothetical protein [Myxococcaceae bacterium]
MTARVPKHRATTPEVATTRAHAPKHAKAADAPAEAAPAAAAAPKAKAKGAPPEKVTKTTFDATAEAAGGETIGTPAKGTHVSGGANTDALFGAAPTAPKGPITLRSLQTSIEKLSSLSPAQLKVVQEQPSEQAQTLTRLQIEGANMAQISTLLGEYSSNRKTGPITKGEEKMLTSLPESMQAMARAGLEPTADNVFAAVKQLTTRTGDQDKLLMSIKDTPARHNFGKQLELQGGLAAAELVSQYAKGRSSRGPADAALTPAEQGMIDALPVGLRDAALAEMQPTPRNVGRAAELLGDTGGVSPMRFAMGGLQTQLDGVLSFLRGDAENVGDVVGTNLSNDERQMLSEMEPKDANRYLLQKRMQEKSEISALLSNLQNMRHQMAMSIIGNMR